MNNPYYVLDVFTETPFEGNQLAVVVTEKELPLATYQKISNEFGFAESSFILLSTESEVLQVRSFTATGFEVWGAGHNLLGAIWVALENKLIPIASQQPDEIEAVIIHNRIKSKVRYTQGKLSGIFMKQRTAQVGNIVPVSLLSEALTLLEADFLRDNWQPAVVTTEVDHLMVPLKNREALNKVIVEKEILQTLSSQYHFEGCYLFVPGDSSEKYMAHTRFFNPGIGITEDAATGSAAGPLAGFLHQQGFIEMGKTYQILQGEKMGRPSVIEVSVEEEGIWVGGKAVNVMKGTIVTG